MESRPLDVALVLEDMNILERRRSNAKAFGVVWNELEARACGCELS